MKKQKKVNARALLKNKWVLFGTAIGLSAIVIISIMTFAGSCSVKNSKECPALKSGSKGEAVRVLQTQLNRACVNNVRNKPGLEIDGNFGPKTEDAVKYFQNNWMKGRNYKNIINTGTVGSITWSALNEAKSNGCKDNGTAGTLTVW